MNKTKIAIVSSGYFPIPPVKGGAIETLVNMLFEENSKEKKMNLTIYSMYDEEARREANVSNENGIIYISIPGIVKILDRVTYCIFKNILRKKKHMSYRYIFQRLYYLSAVSKSISKINYDRIILENHPTMFGVLKGHGNRKRYKGKYYYHAHNEITKTFGYDKYLKEAKGFICVSKFIANTIHSLLPEYPVDRIKVLRNRVDEQKFRDLSAEKKKKFSEKYHIPSDKIIFTFTGRLNPEKGVKELLMAYKNSHPSNSKLIIAGSYYFGSGIKSEYEMELQSLAEEIKDDIIFTGNIDYEEMPYLYDASDVIVLPSIWNDPAPLTVIESITSGKPLITTYSGGIPEYANENNSIIINVDEGLVDNLTNAIKKLSDDEKLRTDLIEKTKQESSEWRKKDYYYDFINLVQ